KEAHRHHRFATADDAAVLSRERWDEHKSRKPAETTKLDSTAYRIKAEAHHSPLPENSFGLTQNHKPHLLSSRSGNSARRAEAPGDVDCRLPKCRFASLCVDLPAQMA